MFVAYDRKMGVVYQVTCLKLAVGDPNSSCMLPDIDNASACNQVCALPDNGGTSGQCITDADKQNDISSTVVKCYCKIC